MQEQTAVAIVIPEINDLKKSNAQLKERIETAVITDQETYDKANELYKEAKEQIKAITARLDPCKKKAKDAYDDWVTLIKDLTGPPEMVITILKKKIGFWLTEQQRIEDEAKAKLRKEEEDKRLKDAEVFQEQGLEEEADKLLTKQVRINKAEIPTTDRGGTFVSKRYYAEVVNKMALIKAVAAGEIEAAALTPNMPWLNSQAVQHKEELKIPGVVAKFNTTVGSRG